MKVPAGVPQLELIAPPGLPEVRHNDDLCTFIAEGLAAVDVHPADLDILVVTQKIISKAEGRLVSLQSVQPSPEAIRLALETAMDERIVQLILDESREVLRWTRGIIMVVHRLGFVTSNAGVDRSNVPDGHALLLPQAPDVSASVLREQLMARFGTRLAVIISDSMGRPWRNGTIGHAIGVAGMDPLVDLRGRPDRTGRALQKTRVSAADAIAAAATLLMGEADESRPFVLVRGYRHGSDHTGVAPLLRDPSRELFR